MNILHVTHLYYPAFGGTEIHTRELSLQLAKEGNRVTIFTTDAFSPIGLFKKTKECLRVGVFKDSQVGVYRFHVVNSSISRWPLRYILIICAAAKKFMRIHQPYDSAEALWNTPIVPKWYFELLGNVDFDIANVTPFPLGHCYFLRYFCNKKHIPFIITPRTHAFDPMYGKPFLIKSALKADGVIALTEAEKDYFARQGVDKAKIFVTGIGISPMANSGINQSLFRNRFGVPADSRIVLFIGRIEKNKGIEILIEGMKIVWNTEPNTFLLILGKSSSYASKIYKIACTEKRIIFLPDASDATKNAALCSSNLLILPSVCESFGGVFLEAWMAEKPVIGCATPAIRCVVDDEVDGLLLRSLSKTEIAEKILLLLKNETMAEEMGKKGKEKVLRYYTWEKISKKTLEVYKNLV